MNNIPSHIDLTPAETERLAQAIEYIAKHQSNETVGAIKRKFQMTDAEYDTAMDLAMPAIRGYGWAKSWKTQFLRLLRELMRVAAPMDELHPEHRLGGRYDPNPDARLEALEQMISETYGAFCLSGISADEVLERRLRGEDEA